MGIMFAIPKHPEIRMNAFVDEILAKCSQASEAMHLDDKHEILAELVGFMRDSKPLSSKEIDAVLDSCLSPALHGVGYVFLLSSKAVQPYDVDLFIQQTISMINECPCEHAKHVLKEFSQVIGNIAIMLRENPSLECKQLILPLSQAIITLQSGDPFVFTKAHAPFVWTCLRTGNLRFALAVLSVRPFKVCNPEHEIEALDLLLFYYGSAYLFSAFGEFNKALSHLRLLFLVPSACLSKVQIKSMKLWIIIGTILGQPTMIPSQSSEIVRTHFKKVLHELGFVGASLTYSPLDAQKCLEKHKSILAKDGLYGLAMQIVPNLRKQRIVKLGRVFKSVFFDQIREVCEFSCEQEVVDMLVEMISNNEIAAHIDFEGKALFFRNISKEGLCDALDLRIQQVSEIGDDLRHQLEVLQLNTATSKVASSLSVLGNQEAVDLNRH